MGARNAVYIIRGLARRGARTKAVRNGDVAQGGFKGLVALSAARIGSFYVVHEGGAALWPGLLRFVEGGSQRS